MHRLRVRDLDFVRQAILKSLWKRDDASGMRRNRLLRLWAAWAALVAVLGFVAPSAVFAGALTSATFTTSGTGYAVTSAKNTTYNYGFTTAGSATLSRVSATVPSGTQPYGSRYLAMQGTSGNYASTPDSAANRTFGDIDLRVKVSFTTWPPPAAEMLAEVWSINRSGSNLPADIAADLTVSGLTSLPSGGTASYRMIDGTAVYVLPSATSIAAATPCSISLTGFTNTATAGSYTSTITTYDNSATPAVVDSATTSGLTFTPASNTSIVSATIDPTFTFIVANQATACNGESNFVSAGGSAAAVALGHVSSSANASAGQALTVASNAGGGFNVYLRCTQATQNLRSSSRNWTDVSGSYASPAALGSGEAFGYTYKDSTALTSVTNPASAMFAALTGTNQAIMGSSSSSAGNSCVSFDAQTAPTTSAGTYSATIVYVAVPTF